MSGAKACFFCEKVEADVATLHEGSYGDGPHPRICDDCVLLCLEIFAQEFGGKRRLSRSAGLACSFCGRSRRDVMFLVGGPTDFICDDCVADFAPPGGV